MPTLKITLPLPDRKLSPNGRAHWAVKQRLTRTHRQQAKEALFELVKVLPGPYYVTGYRLYPFYSTVRFWDDDNLTGSCKAYRDGWSDATGQDDRYFRCLEIIPARDTKYPRLEVEIDITFLVDDPTA